MALDRPTRQLIQQGLRNEGFNPGVPDGLFGPRTREAIRRWQEARGALATGYLSAAEAEFLSAAGAAAVGAEPPLSGDDIDVIARSVVRVVALQDGEEVSSGSGTVVDRGGLIFTNRHVVEGAEDYRVEVLENPNELPVFLYLARLVGYSTDVDFALLQVDRNNLGQPISANRINLPFLSSVTEDAQRGDEILVFGYPGIGDGYLAVTRGTVTTIRNGTLNDQRMPVWYQTDAQMAPGNSGGLVVNAQGEMVGIPTSVQTEEGTGGRLGGILAFNAVRAAMDGGLETDMSRFSDATITPVIADGVLDFQEDPTFGSAALSAGFAPDPHTVEMVSGGEVEAAYLGGECTGYAAVAPDFRMNWSGIASMLRIFFAADDGGDTTLVINLPDGSWVCNDDADGTVDPMVVLRNPPQGQYDVWVGSFDAGAFVPGTLNVTELDLDPIASGPNELDYMMDPSFGSLALRAGFTPDPNVSQIVGGGMIDASYLEGDCVGHAAQAPDVRLEWSGVSNELHIFFAADDGDATLVINLPDGSWVCNDDADGFTLNPMVTLRNPSDGQYDIWVGSYERGQFISGTLSVTELDLEP